MSGPISFSNRSHFVYPLAHADAPIPITAIINSLAQVASSIDKEKLIPIHQTFGSLIQESLSNKTSFNATIASQNPLSLSSTLDKIDTKELTREIALLQREVLKTMQNKPTCPLSTLAIWPQEMSDNCYAVEMMEERITSLMAQARGSLSVDDAELEKYGKKHKNIIKQARLIEGLKLPGLSVPIPHGMASDKVHTFLKEYVPTIFSEWETLGKEYADYQGQTPFFDEPQSKSRLQAIEKGIKEAFRQAGEDLVLFQKLASPELMAWLDGVRANNDYLMVRSTGAEDSRQTANAGGNKSPAYVSPTPQAFCEAAGEVVISYFGFGSLQNRVNAGLNPFEHELKLAVTAQQLIGEPIGGTPNPKSIPISLVLFTSEPLYIGNEKFRTMRISATYGHGEGVVGGLGIGTDTVLILISEAHPDRLYVLYENSDKPVRLAPVKTAIGVELQPVDNPEHLQKAPVLNDELLTRLYTWGVVGEKFFDDYPTDMEIVIKNGIIYPVQARPINRPGLLPTYVDMKRVAALQAPIIDKLQGELLVPGRASAVVITDPQQINFAKTLKEAEDASHKKKYDIVMVVKPEPANSHPVVNFSGLGMPCLVVKDEEHAQALINQASPEHPVVVDMQTGIVMLWDKAKHVNACIVKGFAVHPAKIAISLPVAAKAVPKIRGEVPQEVKDLILAISIATTKEEAQESLQALRQYPFVASLKEQRAALSKHQVTIRKVKETQEVLASLDQRIDEAFKETTASLQQAPQDARLQQLIRVKVLSSLLTEKEGTGLAQFSRLSVEPLYDEALTLIEYQKSLSHPAHFADFVSLGSQALLPETQKAWVDFLKTLEPLAQSGKISKQQMTQFQKMLENLEKTGMLPHWLTFVFPQAASQGLLSFIYESSPTDKFNEMLSSLPANEKPFLDHFLSLNQALSINQGQIDLFRSPETFDKGWKWLQKQVEKVKSQMLVGPNGSLADQLRSSSPMSKTLAFKVMGQLVDTFDLSIKAMKSSSQCSEADRVKLFKQMLGPYLDLLLDWGSTLNTAGIPTNGNWPIPTYLAEITRLFDAMPDNDAAHLNPSRGFSVVAAMLGSSTEFGRHYPVHLEDLFTLCHQNLLALLNHNSNQLYQANTVGEAPLPDLLKHMFTHVDERHFRRRIERSSLEVSESGILAKYNIPLRNHSAQMWLQYDRQTGEITLKGFLLGPARSRWGLSRSLLLILDQLGLPLSESIHMSDQEMNFSWKIKDSESFTMAKKEWLFLLEMSLDPSLESDSLTRLAQRRGMTAQAITDKVLSTLRQHKSSLDAPSLELYLPFVNNGYGIGEALATLNLSSKTTNQELLKARFELMGAIVRQNQGLDTAISMVSEGLMAQDELTKEKTTELLELLIVLKRDEIQIQIAEVAKKEIKDVNPHHRLKGIRLMHGLILTLLERNPFWKHKEDRTAALLIAKEGWQDSEESIRVGSLQLLTSTITRNHGVAKALIVAQQGLLDTNNNIRKECIPLLRAIVERGLSSEKTQGIKMAIPIADAQHMALNPLEMVKLMQAVIEKDQGFNEAIAIVQMGMQDPSPLIRKESLDLMTALAEKDQGLAEGVAFAEAGSQDSWQPVRQAATRLLIELVTRDQGIPAAIAFATNRRDPPSPLDFELLNLLAKRKLAFDLGIAAAKQGAENAYVQILDLLQTIAEESQEFQKELADIAFIVLDIFPKVRVSQTLGDPKDRLNKCFKSMDLIITVANKGVGLQAIIAMATAGMIDRDPILRTKSIEIMKTFVNLGGNLDATIAIAKRGIYDSDSTVRAETKNLIQAILDKTHLPTMKTVLDITSEGIMTSNNETTIGDIIELLKTHVKQEQKLTEEAAATCIVAVTRGIKASDLAIRKSATELFGILVKQGYRSLIFKADPIAYAKLWWHAS